jgi:DNA-binding LacI/PurR family transcriptional regulator
MNFKSFLTISWGNEQINIGLKRRKSKRFVKYFMYLYVKISMAGIMMKSNRRLTIGYIAQHCYDGIGLKLLSGVTNAAKERDLNLIHMIGGSTLTTDGIRREELTVMELLNPGRLDGLISWASSFRYYMDYEEIKKFHQRFAPLPLVSIGMQLEGATAIRGSDFDGIRQLMEHLTKVHSFRRIAFIKEKNGRLPSDQRFGTYRQMLTEYHLEFDPQLVVEMPEVSEKNGQSAVHVLFDERKLRPGIDVEAIVTVSDILASAAVEEMRSMGIKVPTDVAVVGYNNRLECVNRSIPLTTIDNNFYDRGYRAVDELLQLIESGERKS